MSSIIMIVFLGLLGFIFLIWFIVIYNKIVSCEQSSISALSSIGIDLKRRSDLIPEIINTVKGFVSHEDQIMKRLTELRSDINKIKNDDKLALINIDREFFKSVFAVTEAYPNLRSADAFIKLQDILEHTEANI